ncbi:hypothetical protein EKA95_10940 [Streptococcus pseudopneumoniae]|nr:hypothetical protein [Streptococcus pseudopneumoniae]NIB73415.1 hypothetical protein [Streptococcus pseudopneumoniae]NIB75480.1 hypothetical protein [Streptococcus pseudopneumoniae]NIB81670.1 hypothetical protein [Streptococcus pseudopneumoniae]NIB87538.1 hypothetical protein [Streptococcus pseudopneumoniae]
MAFQPRFGIQPCLSVGIFYLGLYLLENIISFSKLYYYIMFLRTCKAVYEKNIKSSQNIWILFDLILIMPNFKFKLAMKKSSLGDL